ncbi:MAG: YbaB/EbfC family nucleoid-associated protein [Clostridia bacterium]|nr:YbaB/EbfC family nucleoid-associated protein [Clostridia bacterium]
MAKGGFPRGMGGGANMNQMIKQAQKMQEQMLKMQEEMETKTYEAVVGGGAVKVVIDGKREIKEITLSPEVVDPDDIEMLQDLVVAAVNEGLRKVDAESSAQLGSITGGLNIPGLF